MKLLVIDWDFFFPNPLEGGEFRGRDDIYLYDWGHKEAPLFITMMWPMREAAFLSYGLPLPGTNGEESNFWDRFNISKNATLFYADSNSWAGTERISRDVDEVWLYDAHHDSGYGGYKSLVKVAESGQISCEDWMVVYYLREAELHMRYPSWKVEWDGEPTPPIPLDRKVDDGSSPGVLFNRVFVCRSGAWTPTWIEDEFWKFIEDAPLKRKVSMDGIVRRERDDSSVNQHLDSFLAVHKKNGLEV